MNQENYQVEPSSPAADHEEQESRSYEGQLLQRIAEADARQRAISERAAQALQNVQRTQNMRDQIHTLRAQN